jgi:hypothetical protein
MPFSHAFTHTFRSRTCFSTVRSSSQRMGWLRVPVGPLHTYYNVLYSPQLTWTIYSNTCSIRRNVHVIFNSYTHTFRVPTYISTMRLISHQIVCVAFNVGSTAHMFRCLKLSPANMKNSVQNVFYMRKSACHLVMRLPIYFARVLVFQRCARAPTELDGYTFRLGPFHTYYNVLYSPQHTWTIHWNTCSIWGIIHVIFNSCTHAFRVIT